MKNISFEQKPLKNSSLNKRKAGISILIKILRKDMVRETAIYYTKQLVLPAKNSSKPFSLHSTKRFS